MQYRHLAGLTVLVALAACGRPSKPFDPFPKAAVVRAPAKAAWVPRKVVADADSVEASTVTVGAGETLAQVAERTRVPVGALIAANGLAGPMLFAGQTLKIPAGRVHSVKPGETGIAIARAYGLQWSRVVTLNGLRAPYVLEVGDRLLLPSKQVAAAFRLEARDAAFSIDIDDLITGGEPAAAPGRPVIAAMKPLPAVAGPPPKFVWPVVGRVVSGFGAKPGGRFNDGVNIEVATGEPVRAASDGVVAYAGSAVAGFGNLVLIKHADGWVSAYGHNSALLVTRGKTVRQGEVIARAGQTGAVSSPQLHFELRRGRAAVDPVKQLPAQG